MNFLIYVLSACCFTCATFVIGVINPIHSILLLILVFFFGSILLLILNMEFFALIFLIVYVGAIAVLFLFMVMTLDIKISNISQKFQDFFSYRSIIILLILFNLFIFLNEEYVYMFNNYNLIGNETFLLKINKLKDLNEILYPINDTSAIYGSPMDEYTSYHKSINYTPHLKELGIALFTDHIISFLLCGFILLIAMIGAIVVTVEDVKFKSIKQQDPVNQAYRNSENSIFNFKIYKKKIKKLY